MRFINEHGFGLFRGLSCSSILKSEILITVCVWFFSLLRDVIKRIDQSEFEGFEYINPMLLSTEETVWGRNTTERFCQLARGSEWATGGAFTSDWVTSASEREKTPSITASSPTAPLSHSSSHRPLAHTLSQTHLELFWRQKHNKRKENWRSFTFSKTEFLQKLSRLSSSFPSSSPISLVFVPVLVTTQNPLLQLIVLFENLI